MKIVIM